MRDRQKILHDDDALRISLIERGSKTNMLVCFTDAGLEMGHVGAAMSVAREQPEQFVKTADYLDFSAIYITDKTVSWGNHLDFGHIARLVETEAQGRLLTLLGVSMGGFNAIVASNHIKARLCMAFCPQFSIHPDIMPHEERYKNYARQIRHFAIPSLANQFNPQCVYYTFNGSSGADQFHWEKFPVLDYARHYVFPDIDHRVARELRKRNVLIPLIAACINGKEPGAALSGHVSYFIHEIG